MAGHGKTGALARATEANAVAERRSQPGHRQIPRAVGHHRTRAAGADIGPRQEIWRNLIRKH